MQGRSATQLLCCKKRCANERMCGQLCGNFDHIPFDTRQQQKCMQRAKYFRLYVLIGWLLFITSIVLKSTKQVFLASSSHLFFFGVLYEYKNIAKKFKTNV
jgi:hypothetical protein